MTTMTEQTTQVTRRFHPRHAAAGVGGDHEARVHDPLLLRVRHRLDVRPGEPYLGLSGDRQQKLVDGEVLESDPPRLLGRGVRSTTRRAPASRTAA
jgi:hypothetical protein